MLGDKPTGKPEVQSEVRPPLVKLEFGKCGSCNAPVGGPITSRFVTHVTCSLCRRPTCLVCMRMRRSRPICKACEAGSKKQETETEATAAEGTEE
jgi:hypothetical protein